MLWCIPPQLTRPVNIYMAAVLYAIAAHRVLAERRRNWELGNFCERLNFKRGPTAHPVLL